MVCMHSKLADASERIALAMNMKSKNITNVEDVYPLKITLWKLATNAYIRTKN